MRGSAPAKGTNAQFRDSGPYRRERVPLRDNEPQDSGFRDSGPMDRGPTRDSGPVQREQRDSGPVERGPHTNGTSRATRTGEHAIAAALNGTRSAREVLDHGTDAEPRPSGRPHSRPATNGSPHRNGTSRPADPDTATAGASEPTRFTRPVTKPSQERTRLTKPVTSERTKFTSDRSKLADERTKLTPAPKPSIERTLLPTADVASRPWRNAPTELIQKISNEPIKHPAIAALGMSSVQEDDPEENPKTRLQEKRKRKDHRAILTAKVAAIALAVLTFIATGAAWGTKAWYNSKFTQVAALDENSRDIKDAPLQFGDENFLILGSDTRSGAEKEEGVGTEASIGGARSDTVMLAHVPKDRKRAVVVSFPRDLEVTRPECNRWDSKSGKYTDEIVPASDFQKLTWVYSVGGPRCVIKLVQQISGIKLNHFVGIDFHGFKDMVDAVGGITVNVDEPIIDEKVGTVATKAGPLKLNGDRALRFVRARYVIGDPTSDYGRIKRQQQFISALLGKTMSKDVILNPAKLTRLVNAFAAATFGDNIGVDQLFMLARTMKGFEQSKIKFLTIPTIGYSNERGNEVLLQDQSEILFKALIDGGPLPGEEPPPPNAQAQQQQSTVAPG